MTILTDVLRDSSRSQAVRLYTLASLGELIFYIASQVGITCMYRGSVGLR